MKLPFALIFALSLLTASLAHAAPLDLHNRIVFVTSTPESNRVTAVWTIKPDGRDRRQVWQTDGNPDNFGGFTRDGKRALSFDISTVLIREVGTSRSATIPVKPKGEWYQVRSASFTANDQKIRCDMDPGWGSESPTRSFLVDLRAGHHHAVTEISYAQPPAQKGFKPGSWSSPQWSPDGKHYTAVFWPKVPEFGASYASSLGSLWLMNAHGKVQRRLSEPAMTPYEAVWSGDSQTVVFEVRMFPAPIGERPGFFNLWIANLKSGKGHQLTHYPDPGRTGPHYTPYNELVSPNGQRIIFQRGDSMRSVDSDGKNEHQLAVGRLVQWVK